MTKRLLPHTLLSIAAFAMLSAGCNGGGDDGDLPRVPFVDDWETVATLPAAQFGLISVGDTITSDNFANRGDVEILYVAGTDAITIEMQRFTVAESEAEADENFAKMQYWGYALSSPEPPAADNELDQCINPDPDVVDRCYIRNYYDGQTQPIRDGANFRVTVPEGWAGDVLVVTSDNLAEGVETYPDRSNVTVDGLNGNLEVELDSGNVAVRMDPNIAHFAGCSNSDTCEADGFPMGCGCSVPTNVLVENRVGQASNITVDVGAADNWYTMILENRGDFSASDDFVCNATIDCSPFADCAINEEYAGDPAQERAEINFPDNGMAAEGAGIRIALTSEDCANITYADGPEDHGSDALPEEKRGEVQVCIGCL